MFYLKRYGFIALIGYLVFLAIGSFSWKDISHYEDRANSIISKRVSNPGYKPFCGLSAPEHPNLVNIAIDNDHKGKDISLLGETYDYYNFNKYPDVKAHIFVIEDKKVSGTFGTENSNDFLRQIKHRFGHQVEVGYFNIESNYIQLMRKRNRGLVNTDTILLPTSKSSEDAWKRSIKQSRIKCGFKWSAYSQGGQLIVRVGDGQWYMAHGTSAAFREHILKLRKNNNDDHPLLKTQREKRAIHRKVKGGAGAFEVITPRGVDDLLIKHGLKYDNRGRESIYRHAHFSEYLHPYDANATLNMIKELL